jgi:hypothetical protein
MTMALSAAVLGGALGGAGVTPLVFTAAVGWITLLGRGVGLPPQDVISNPVKRNAERWTQIKCDMAVIIDICTQASSREWHGERNINLTEILEVEGPRRFRWQILLAPVQ